MSDTDWFSRYKFCQPLGQGGMGTVYLAEDRQAENRPCVIKQLTNKFTDPHEHSEAIRLFQREASILRSLYHAGVVRVFDDHATGDGRYFLVMDYVPGKNLEVMLNTGGPFSTDFTVQLSIQCCEVLDYLHNQNPPVIYRDLKPSNLMLTPEGRIIFIDFGIARSFMPTQAATRVVTAGYSPPEQYYGKPEIRSDLYSLGATMSHLLTGRRPKPLTACSPRSFNPEVRPSLDDLVRRLTAHNPEDRPETASAVRFELYMIYKEHYPDFEIPEEARPREHAEPQMSNAYVRARYGHLPTDRMETMPPPSAREARQAMKVSGGEPEPPKFWQRVKQWFQIWMS